MARILVIEDTHSLRKDIQEMLTFEGFQVVDAEDGVVGIQTARDYQPDLIICDILMPGMDGYQVLETLKQDPNLATTPFIFLTAKADKSDIRRGMEMGAYDYLTKPFTAPELIAAVYTQLEKRNVLARVSEKKLDDLRESIMLALPHELRTPLTSILGFSDIIVTDCGYRDPDQIIEMARYINSAGVRLFRLAENYLAYAQLEVMATNPDWLRNLRGWVTTDPRIIVESQALVKAQTVNRESDLVLDVVDDAPVKILDEHLRKVVEELVDNSLKFSTQGTPVKVTTEVRGGQYVLTITDHGRGMTPAQIRAVGAYMQFGRKGLEQQGIGLGLTISRRLAELYDGRLALSSAIDRYTEVAVSLPLA